MPLPEIHRHYGVRFYGFISYEKHHITKSVNGCAHCVEELFCSSIVSIILTSDFQCLDLQLRLGVYRSSQWAGFSCRSTSRQQHCSSSRLGWNPTWSSSLTQCYLWKDSCHASWFPVLKTCWFDLVQSFGSPMQTHPPKHSPFRSRQDRGRLPRVRTPLLSWNGII